jgi:hypothetical protein
MQGPSMFLSHCGVVFIFRREDSRPEFPVEA